MLGERLIGVLEWGVFLFELDQGFPLDQRALWCVGKPPCRRWSLQLEDLSAFKEGRLGASCASRLFDIEGNNLTPRPM